MSKTVAVDYESFWTQSYSVSTMGAWHYTNDPRFNAYLVALFGHDIAFVGHPKDAPWNKIKDYIWTSQNKQFDELVHQRLIKDGVVSVYPKEWYCTANLSAYFCGCRALDGASEILLGEKISKEVRTQLKNHTWSDFEQNDKLFLEYQKIISDPAYKANKYKNDIEEYTDHLKYKRMTAKQIESFNARFERMFKKEQTKAEKKLSKLVTTEIVKKYALKDAEQSWKIWERYGHLWPQFERDISEVTRLQGLRGIYIDQPKLNKYIKQTEYYQSLALKRLPWVARDWKALSLDAIKEQCQIECIWCPDSFAEKEEKAKEWEKEFASKYRWVRGIRSYRKLNKALKELLKFKSRVMPNGRLYHEAFYFGAHTGRDASAGGVNLRNLKKKRQYRIDIRSIFIPEPGKKFVLFDLGSIEPRILRYFSGEFDVLKLLEQGMSPYEVHARKYMGWEGGELKKQDKKKYALAKARELGCGYYLGHEKLITMTPQYGIHPREIFDDPVRNYDIQQFKEWCEKWNNRAWANYEKAEDFRKRWFVNSWLTVQDFRRKNVSLRENVWKPFTEQIERSVGGDMRVLLPSGREIVYRQVKKEGTNHTGLIAGERIKLYNGHCTENKVQATARDVFWHNILECEKQGIPTLWTVYDEGIFEVEDSFDSNKIHVIMTQRPEWLKEVPLEGELQEAYCYKK